MRLHLRGLTPFKTGMDDRQGTRKVKNTSEVIEALPLEGATK
jgi:hypothetical protein